jgi:C2H2 transcription facotor
MDPNMMAAAMGPAPFYYYTPEPSPENRQHGHFSQHPALQQLQPQQQQLYPVVPTVPSTPVYSRPSSSSSQQMPTKVFNPMPSTLTPMASPQTTHRAGFLVQAPPAKLMLDTEFCEADGIYYPATPPLSSSSSSIGSPEHSTNEVLATPLNPMFSGLDGYDAAKPEPEMNTQKLEALDWSSCGSPPLTPGKLKLFLFEDPSFFSLNLGCGSVCMEIILGSYVLFDANRWAWAFWDFQK